MDNEIRQQLLETTLELSNPLGGHERMILEEQALTLARFLHHPHITERQP